MGFRENINPKEETLVKNKQTMIKIGIIAKSIPKKSNLTPGKKLSSDNSKINTI